MEPLNNAVPCGALKEAFSKDPSSYPGEDDPMIICMKCKDID